MSRKLFLLLLVVSACTKRTSTSETQAPIYSSTNLQGHDVVTEYNPGSTTTCACGNSDVAIQSSDDYGEVTSNPMGNHTWVNAIGRKHFEETFTSGASIGLGTYKYS